ncbi:hypothetical protein RRG08_061353 [Elysia crispata]|uniref:Uncharacterized protein n=1 Tax=Elysia crispata TaxID=231223 RepID=A0AAE1AFS5_9GAST|nr:hypothetical protein RRG08_061353 [Elysia crispata]
MYKANTEEKMEPKLRKLEKRLDQQPTSRISYLRWQETFGPWIWSHLTSRFGGGQLKVSVMAVNVGQQEAGESLTGHHMGRSYWCCGRDPSGVAAEILVMLRPNLSESSARI